MSQQPMIPPLRGDKYLPVKEIPENRRYVMDYDLTRGCSTTNKFISLMKKTQSYGEWSTSWNFYPTIDRKRFIQMKNILIVEGNLREENENFSKVGIQTHT